MIAAEEAWPTPVLVEKKFTQGDPIMRILVSVLLIAATAAGFVGNSAAQATPNERKAQAITELLLEQKRQEERAAIEKAKNELVRSQGTSPSNSTEGTGGIPWPLQVVMWITILILIIYLLLRRETRKDASRNVSSSDLTRWEIVARRRMEIYDADPESVKETKRRQLRWFEEFKTKIIQSPNGVAYQQAETEYSKNIRNYFFNRP